MQNCREGLSRSRGQLRQSRGCALGGVWWLPAWQGSIRPALVPESCTRLGTGGCWVQGAASPPGLSRLPRMALSQAGEVIPGQRALPAGRGE